MGARACIADGGGFTDALCGRACACFAKRAAAEPRYRRVAHIVAPGYLDQRFLARSKPLDSLLALVRCQGRRSAEFDSTGLRTLSALACTSADQLALKL